jgi:ABC-type transport system involved in cytochrome c biogenesis permease subunit
MVVLLIPWKSAVIRRGLRRARSSRWASLLLALLAVTTILAGLGYTTGLVRSIGGVRGMWIHVAAALALVPLAGWHVLARHTRPRKADLSRRVLLRTGMLTAAAAGVYVATASAVRLTRLIVSSRIPPPLRPGSPPGRTRVSGIRFSAAQPPPPGAQR